MKKLAFGALFVGLALIACGGGSNNNGIHIVDGGSGDAGTAVCNVLTQTGCSTGQKCTWIEDSTTLGHVGCAANGTVAVGGTCTYGAPGATGFDNCVGGTVCLGGICKTICDQNGGSPTCDATHSCQVYSGFLGPQGSEAGGVCDPTCNPLNDNDFDGSGTMFTKSGTACTQDEGCYGIWSNTSKTHFSCSRVPSGSTMLFHRSPCNTANGCAQGYIALFYDMTGSTNVVCTAYCAPSDCSSGNCPNPHGGAGTPLVHGCSNLYAMGTFNNNPNGDQCAYGWWINEIGSNGSILKSDFSDTTGLCLDHSKYKMTDMGGSNASSTPWPACNTLALGSPAGSGSAATCYGDTGAGVLTGCVAADFGCVESSMSGLPTMFSGVGSTHLTHVDKPRMPYHSTASRF